MYATQTLWLTRVHGNNLYADRIEPDNFEYEFLRLPFTTIYKQHARVLQWLVPFFGGICRIASAFRIRSYESNVLVQLLASRGHSCLDGLRQGATSDKVRCLAPVLPAFESHNTGTCWVLLHTRMFPTPPRWSSIRRSRIG